MRTGCNGSGDGSDGAATGAARAATSSLERLFVGILISEAGEPPAQRALPCTRCSQSQTTPRPATLGAYGSGPVRTGTAVPPVSLRTALYATSSTSSPRAASYRYVADVHRLGLVLQLGQGKAVELRVGKVREWTCCWTVNKIVLTAPENIPWYQFVVCSVHSDSCSCPGC